METLEGENFGVWRIFFLFWFCFEIGFSYIAHVHLNMYMLFPCPNLQVPGL